MANPFKKNDPRINRLGRPKKGKTLTEALERAMKKKRDDGKKNSEALADVLIDLAIKEKNIAAVKYLFDRLDGKPVETLSINEVDIESALATAFNSTQEPEIETGEETP
jgi:hypothetical protein